MHLDSLFEWSTPPASQYMLYIDFIILSTLMIRCFTIHWRIQGAPPARPPKGPDSFILIYKFFET